MRFGLVVEGSHLYHDRTRADLLTKLWRDVIPAKLRCQPPDAVMGITKGSLAAMRLAKTNYRQTTSLAEPLDQALERFRRNFSLDCFVVAWDLVPPWDKEISLCRWTETLALYEGLSLSTSLDARLRDFAAKRFAEMRSRPMPSQRTETPQLAPGTVWAVCMEMEFESTFLNERAMRKALGVEKKKTKDWPSQWDPSIRDPTRIVAAAIESARNTSRSFHAFRKIRQSYELRKTEWGLYLLQSGSFDDHLVSHPIGRRFSEVCATPPVLRKRR